MMLWSEQAYQLSVKAYPSTAATLRVSGAIGYDRFKILNFKREILFKGFKKVICYAANDFCNVENQREKFVADCGVEFYEKNQAQAKKIKSVLTRLVSDNPDVLFCIKPHPGDGIQIPLEIRGLEKVKNVRLLPFDFPLVEMISASDIWLNYRSSTSVEAWLLGKPSISLCEDDQLLAHSEYCRGSILSENVDEIAAFVSEFYRTGRIRAFDNLQAKRDQIIKDFVGFSDGFNHVRFMSFLRPWIEDNALKPGRFSSSFWKTLCTFWYYKVRYHATKRWTKLFSFRQRADHFSDSDVKRAKQERFPDFDAFYAKNKSKIEALYLNYATEWERTHL